MFKRSRAEAHCDDTATLAYLLIYSEDTGRRIKGSSRESGDRLVGLRVHKTVHAAVQQTDNRPTRCGSSLTAHTKLGGYFRNGRRRTAFSDYTGPDLFCSTFFIFSYFCFLFFT